MSKRTYNATSSRESEGGRLRYAKKDLKGSKESGLVHARVNRSQRRESAGGKKIRGTSGRYGNGSSRSAALQSCMESRLRALLDVNGSPEFALTWKSWDMPAGEPICALRASERRTGDKGCSGWPTCLARDWKYTPGMSETGTNPDGSRRSRLDTLPSVAALAWWHTPKACETCEKPGQHAKRNADRTETCTGSLSEQAKLAGWQTPTVEDAGRDGSLKDYMAYVNNGQTSGCRLRSQAQAVLVGWPTPRTPTGGPESAERKQELGRTQSGGGDLAAIANLAGPASTSCPAGMGKRGVLRPGHSRWLMGFPGVWDSCGATAMQSCRKSPRCS